MVSNNWFTLPLTVKSTDFQSLDASQMTLPRQADGSLPNLTFMNLTPGSDLIDAGLNVGLPYNGAAPDLGAFETPEPSCAAGIVMLLATFATRHRRFALKVRRVFSRG
jgi:hypothetical protein